MMINLIRKDIILAKKINIFIFMYVIFISFLGLTNPHMTEVLYVMTLGMLVYIATLYINGYDTKNNSEVFINSLPIRKRDVVRSKYLQIFILLAFFSLVMVIFTNIVIGLNLSFIPKDTRPVNNLDIIISSMFISFFYGIYYPIYFKFGGEKLKVFNNLIFIVIIALPGALVKLSKNHIGSPVVEWFKMVNLEGLVISLWGICIVLFIASMFLSQWIYQRRDL